MANLHKTSSPKIIWKMTDLPSFFQVLISPHLFRLFSPLAYHLGLANIFLACFRIQMPRTSVSEDMHFLMLEI